jgi:hypothetical protein
MYPPKALDPANTAGEGEKFPAGRRVASIYQQSGRVGWLGRDVSSKTAEVVVERRLC